MFFCYQVRRVNRGYSGNRKCRFVKEVLGHITSYRYFFTIFLIFLFFCFFFCFQVIDDVVSTHKQLRIRLLCFSDS